MDLTKESDVLELMRSSKTENEWNDNCDKVKHANDGYPAFWWAGIALKTSDIRAGFA